MFISYQKKTSSLSVFDVFGLRDLSFQEIRYFFVFVRIVESSLY